ncbi:hydroxyphenylacetyl-CoA thioesterase PaaI [Allokutzneria multivorans]|uniref:Hydroxyphenylacetyl-CoA thioesterase PaaI n=2 Tax=Allokutzneria multivorans TaxID=1142134 RepID=A0ABP7SB42_9PSEU
MSQPQVPDPVRRMYDADNASRAAGIELVEAGIGHASARMRITADMVNGHGIVHGGHVFLLADSTFAFACNSHGPVTVAAGADISFVAAAEEGEELTAVAVERARYGRSGIYDVSVHSGDRLIAEFRGRSRVIGERS